MKKKPEDGEVKKEGAEIKKEETEIKHDAHEVKKEDSEEHAQHKIEEEDITIVEIPKEIEQPKQEDLNIKEEQKKKILQLNQGMRMSALVSSKKSQKLSKKKFSHKKIS